MSVLLIVWSVINILIGSFIFGIIALVFSINYNQGDDDSRGKAIIFNSIATVFGIIGWILLIVIMTTYNK
jgi:hypothetical protein